MMRALSTATATVLAAGVLIGCSTTTGGTGTHSPVPRPPAPSVPSSRGIAPLPSASVPPSGPPSVAPPSSVPAPSTIPSSAPGSGVPADVARVLLTPAEIGHGFVQTGTETTSSEPYPCTQNDPPVDVAVPPSETGTADFAKSSARLAVTEQVSVYPDVDHAQHAEQLVEAGLACSHGTLSTGRSVKLKGPSDISSVVTANVDKAEVWDIRAASTTGALVQVRIHAVLVHFAFLAVNNKDPKLDATQILQTGIAKVINGG
jgi:hypothetical protein